MEAGIILGGGLLLAVLVIVLKKSLKNDNPIKEGDHSLPARSEAELTKDIEGPFYFQYFDSDEGEWGFLGMDLKHYKEPSHPMVLKCENKTVLRERLQDLRRAIKNFDDKYEVV